VKLYSYFRSSAAYRARIALNLKGLPYEMASIHLTRGGGQQHGAAFRAVNPQRRVPALALDNGDMLIQSLAIIEYLDETHPEPPLLPGHPADRARVRALSQIIACDIHPIDNLRVLRYLAKPLGHDEAAIGVWFNHWIATGFEGLERILANDGQSGTFCHGEAPTLADICLVPQVFNSWRYKLDLAPYPTITRIFDSCMKLPAFEEARPEKQPDAE